MEAANDAQTLRAAACVAGADGEVDPIERRVLARLGERIGVGERSLNALIEQASSDPVFYDQQLDALRKDPKEAMKILFTVAIADGVLLDEEMTVLRHVARKLTLPEEDFDRIHRTAVKHMKQREGD